MRATLILAPIFVMSMTCVSVSAEPSPSRENRQSTKLFFRLLGSQNNAPMIPKSRSAWTQDQQQRTGTTGSSDHGFTEYPFCSGKMDFSFVESHAVYPRLISGAQADERIVNTADILMDHVYQPDGCVWGWSARRFVQTFTATQSEMVSVTLLVASSPGVFRIALLERGPGGHQIGPSKTFVSGHSITWGTARWAAGQAPLVPGRTYAVRIERVDGARWTPYLHSTGDAYDGGQLYADGKALPMSDMALWIVEEPADLKRALLVGTDEEGWVSSINGPQRLIVRRSDWDSSAGGMPAGLECASTTLLSGILAP